MPSIILGAVCLLLFSISSVPHYKSKWGLKQVTLLLPGCPIKPGLSDSLYVLFRHSLPLGIEIFFMLMVFSGRKGGKWISACLEFWVLDSLVHISCRFQLSALLFTNFGAEICVGAQPSLWTRVGVGVQFHCWQDKSPNKASSSIIPDKDSLAQTYLGFSEPSFWLGLVRGP